MADEREMLHAVLAAATDFLDSLDERSVAATADVDQVAATLGGPLPESGEEASAVVAALVAGATPGLVAMPSGRFFGWVIGGVLPAALGADWLTSAWDQNAGLLVSSPAAAAVERVAADWLVDLLGLPTGSAVGFTTGATMANFCCLAAARHDVLRQAGWDVESDGLQGAPTVTVVVGEERHESIDIALRYLGLGESRTLRVPADGQGRLRLGDLATALAGAASGPLIVCLQAGNVHSGGFDPIGDAAELAHSYGAWVHVDGAFGLWAAASPRLRELAPGLAQADSWATDAHKTLNVPYDSGLAVVAHPAALYSAMGAHAAYLIQDERPDPFASVPEFSRRARGFTVWAALRQLGRSGVAELVEGLCRRAQQFAAGLSALPGVEIVNDVVFTQVCASFGGDETTREVSRRLVAGGVAWATTSTWQGRAVLRISVSNWRTTEADVDQTLVEIARILAEVGAARD